jgi:2-keto-4-pentenoate hydratase/2-oxohepta-3-ene-1,7-dioic acid hydratase in catechol pathway
MFVPMPLYGRFEKSGRVFHGEVRGEEVLELDRSPVGCPPLPVATHPLAALAILPPVEPSKLIAVGLNYADHAAETKHEVPKEPLIFLKAPSSLLPHGGTVRVPYPEHRTDFEAELAVVIGQKTLGVSETDALGHVFGITAAQDISDRHIQREDRQWARAKSFDTFTPIGPFVRTDFDPRDLRIRQVQNGEVRQDSRTSQMIFPVAFLVHFISRHITLLPGDVIITGTPSGIGPIRAGDELEVLIEGLEPLRNRVENWEP